MKKVHVWQLGFATQRDKVLHDKSKVECRQMGYVLIDDNEDDPAETVWNLLNWSCWSDNGKPDNVFSPLDHCNDDIIVNVEGTSIYACADFIGFTETTSLKDAIAHSLEHFDGWCFHDVERRSGFYKEIDGKAYWRKNKGDDWKEVTW